MLPLVASVLVSLSVLLIFGSLAVRKTRSELRERMEMYGASTPLAFEQLELQQPFSERVLKPIVTRLLRVFSWVLPTKRIEHLSLRLQMAGNPGGLSTADFVGIKGWVVVVLGGMGLLFILIQPRFSLMSLLVGVLLIILGLRLPDSWLTRRIKQRQHQLTIAMPDALDMLTIAVEAGLSFEQGLSEIVARSNSELSREFRRVLHEIGLGKSRRDALTHFNERTQVPDIQSFVVAVNHAEELGTSLAQVLNVQAQEMRTKRRQRAQEQANKLPVKMLFPLAFLIFPALFIMILGPAVPRIMRTLLPITRGGG